MKTIMIYDSCGQEPTKFGVFDGDLSRFDKVYLNEWIDDALEGHREKEYKQEELHELLFDSDGMDRVEWKDSYPQDIVLEQLAVDQHPVIIICGMIP